MDLAKGTRLGSYEIISPLGSGGMGQVYLAEDVKLGRNVAIKILPERSGTDEQARKRLVREAQMAAKLDHPNICVIHDVSEEAGRCFIVMQYIEGETLASRIQREPMELPALLDTAVQVAAALAEAHSHGIVHRDIKPQNIMITSRGQVKVMDFGLATVVEEQAALESEAETKSLLTEPGMIVGTPSYMSPEHLRSEALDARSDIFSFGAMLYEMVCGRQPFAAESAAATASAILTKEPLPIARFAPEAPQELQRIVRKCLEKDRERRYQTVRDLTIDLENLCHARPAQHPASHASSSEANSTVGSHPVRGLGDLSLSWRTLTLSGSILALIAAALVYAVWFRAASGTDQSDIKSLAVLPLKSLSTGANDDSLGLGIADTIIMKISQIGKITVRPTSAVHKYVHEEVSSLEAARQLQTDAVLDGSVQRAGDHLRVNVNLLRVRDGTSLWAESFDTRQSDIFSIQDTLSKEIVARLKLKLGPTEAARLDKRYTTNQEAYEYYMKGRANFERVTMAIGDRQAIDAAISYFKKAVELDPKYALAYAALGKTYMWMANFNDPDNPAWVGLAQEALSRAEGLDPQLAEIHDARFEYYFSKYGNWDLAQAAREGHQALALNPSVGHRAVGTIYDHLGLDEARGLREYQRNLEIDPTNTSVQNRLIESYTLYGKFDEAIEAQRHFFGTPGPEYALIGKGRVDEAQPLLEEAVKKNSGDLQARGRLALLLALRGKFQEAEAAIPPILEQARNNRAYHHITYDIGCVYALGGKTDKAVKWLRTTAETGMPNYPLFARDPHLDRIRQEPAFVQFMAELKPRWESCKREVE